MMYQLLWLMKHLTPAKPRQQQTLGPGIWNSGPTLSVDRIRAWTAQTRGSRVNALRLGYKKCFNNVNVTLWELNQWHLSVLTVMTSWPLTAECEEGLWGVSNGGMMMMCNYVFVAKLIKTLCSVWDISHWHRGCIRCCCDHAWPRVLWSLRCHGSNTLILYRNPQKFQAIITWSFSAT